MRRRAKIICRAAAAVSVASVLAAGVPPASGQFRVEPTLTVSETFSDNVDRDPKGERDEALLTDVTPGVVLRWDGTRTTTALDLSLTARHQTNGEDEGLQLLPDAAGLGSAELWREHLFFDASGAVSTELLNSREQDTGSARSTVQTYNASPRLVGSFGNFADSETFYHFTQVITDESDTGLASEADNARTHAIGTTLSAGPDFARARWSLSGTASEQQRETSEDVSRREVALDLEYIVDRSFSALGSVGYQIFDDGDPVNEVDDPTWNGGVRWRPGSRTDITITYGQSDNERSLAADARYQLGPQTTVFASYNEVLETGAERLAQDLTFIGTDPDTGQLIDTRTGLPFDPQTNITTVDEGTQRTKTLFTGITGVRGRNTFGVTGRVQFTRDEGARTAGDDEDAYQISATWGRQLSPRSNLATSASYTRNEFEIDSRTDNEYEASATYTYNVYRNVNAFGTYNFGMQTSDSPANEYLENRVTVGVTMRF